MKQFNVEKFPTVLLFKSYDVDTKKILDEEEIITYKKDDIKLDELKKFIRPFTRDETKEPKTEKKIEDSTMKK